MVINKFIAGLAHVNNNLSVLQSLAYNFEYAKWLHRASHVATLLTFMYITVAKVFNSTGYMLVSMFIVIHTYDM